jgi:hypothetical protein
VVGPPLLKILVSSDDFSQYMEKIKNLPNHQPDNHNDVAEKRWN